MAEIALVGAPSSGKSTFFKALTLKDVKIADYPFTTIEPNEGTGFVTAKCPCMERTSPSRMSPNGDVSLCGNCLNGTRLVPLKVWDVAGLVPGASEGRGRGNAFLSDVMQAEGLIHILDATGERDAYGEKTDNCDVSKTIAMLEDEIAKWMTQLVLKDAKVMSHAKDMAETIAKRLSGLGIDKTSVARAIKESGLDLKDERSVYEFCSFLRKEKKPIIIAANKADIAAAELIERIKKEHKAIPTSGDYELALREAGKAGMVRYTPGEDDFDIINQGNERQKAALAKIKLFIKENGGTGVQAAMNKIVFDILGYITVYPVANADWTDSKGRKLPDAKLVKKGSTTHDLAYLIHEDIGKNFVTAVDARTGKAVGGHYELKDGDVITIKAGK